MAGEWQNTTLDQLGKIITGKTPPSSQTDAFGGSILFVTPSDMDGRRMISHTARTLTGSGAATVKGARVPADAVMVSCIGSDMGKAAIAGSDCVTNQQINSIIVEADNCPLYVYYNLSMRKAEIRGAASGSAQPILNKSAFGKLEIILPPPDEQRAIAHLLGTLDDKIELNRRVNETLEAIARAIFKSWFIDFAPVRTKASSQPSESICRSLGLPPDLLALFPNRFRDSELGEIPLGWEVSTLSEHIEIYDSKRIPLSNREREMRRGPYPYYGAAAVMDYVDDYLFDGTYVLMGEDGSVADEEGTPVTQYVWGKFWVNNHAHVLRAKAPMSSEHLLLFLKQINVTPFVTGAVQPKLSQANLKRIPIVTPPNKLLEAFARIVNPLFEMLRVREEEMRTLADIRDAFLPRLLSGELRIPPSGEA